MKALVLEAYKKLVFQAVSDPVPDENEVLVRVSACGICGSDVHGYDGSTGRRIPPLIMGHEAAGQIVYLGRQVTDWQTGERVTFDSTIYKTDDWYTQQRLYNLSEDRMVFGVSTAEYKRDGAFAEYIAVPQHLLHRIPDTVTDTEAALVEPAAVAMHAVNLTPVNENDTAVVVGAGMIGLFIIQALRYKACSKIIAIDVDKTRLDLAVRLGADEGYIAGEKTAAAIKKTLQGRGADIAFDAVGTSASVTTAVDTVRRGAVITLVGNLAPKIDIPLQKIVSEQLRLQGSCAICGEYPLVLDLIKQRIINVHPVISKEAPLSEGAKWFEKLYQGEKGLMKVVLIP